MTAPAECRPPPGTPDGAMLWLRNDKNDGWCVVVWSLVQGDWFHWFPFGGVRPQAMAREGWRFHSLATKPETQ